VTVIPKPGRAKRLSLLLLWVVLDATGLCAHAQNAPAAAKPKSVARQAWRFAVSGDSRNCGDVVMPAIAAGVQRDQAAFYWHLGDLRAIYDFDQDYRQLARQAGKSPTILQYESEAWHDFIEHQITPFGSLPFFLGIGNHETIPPKTRAEFLVEFADWLNAPELQEQRLRDTPNNHRPSTYYHWVRDGIDFINLDNASADQFDDDQMAWFESLVGRDAANPSLLTVVVGMHEALPESISEGHSMNQSARGTQTGRQAYQELLKLQNDAHKKVYVLASHSHFFMEGIFNTDYWREHGGVLPGWIVGTAGAVRYRLPAKSGDAKAAKTDLYGYLLATVNPPDQPPGTIQFQFRQVDRQQIPPEVDARFTPAFVDECFSGNRQ
jgi:hypothetical protein